MKKIYKIYSPNDLNTYYIGKCGGYLSLRLCQHKYYYKKAVKTDRQAGTYYTSYWIIDKGNAKIACIEECEDDVAREREDYWIDQYKRLGYEVVNERTEFNLLIKPSINFMTN